MSLLRLVVSTIAIIASCEASGFGHVVPAIKSTSVVRYAPFYSFPNGVRSIHAVLPAVAPVAPVVRAFAPAPLLPAPVAAPVLPAPPPLFPARVLPAPAFPAPVFRTPFIPAPIPVPLPAPVFAPAPVFPHSIPAAAPVYPAFPRFGPIPTLSAAQFYARPVPAVSTVPFSPIVRAVAPAVLPAPAPVYPAPVFAPSPYGLTRTVAYPAPAPFLPAPLIKHAQAWK
ncbi:predicted GPI-anchored protein 58 [Pararge aegeria]|uniref:predicted GPI-anchored protein 58 n=1 Tax=Pararge aegeria TaxID=116150 RepID=UPI0019CF866D|nr:predicted GPI-anchored protein 58 [Pararge aegeria]